MSENVDRTSDQRVYPTRTADRCSDCPPAGYPTEKTRCYGCPLTNTYKDATGELVIPTAAPSSNQRVWIAMKGNEESLRLAEADGWEVHEVAKAPPTNSPEDIRQSMDLLQQISRDSLRDTAEITSLRAQLSAAHGAQRTAEAETAKAMAAHALDIRDRSLPVETSAPRALAFGDEVTYAPLYDSKLPREGWKVEVLPKLTYVIKHPNGSLIAVDAGEINAVEPTRELTLHDFGYAPGNYTIKCHDCGQEAVGDKRALRCETCAAQALRENRSGAVKASGVSTESCGCSRRADGFKVWCGKHWVERGSENGSEE